jgi:hypothetical protein
MTPKYDKTKQKENIEIENPQTLIYEAIQNSDISVINKLLNEKYNEIILFEDDTQMSSKNNFILFLF